MPKFIITEERTEIYSCTIEAKDWKDAQKLYGEDSEEIFGDQWEQDETHGVTLRTICELNEEGDVKVTHVFENESRIDSFAHKEEKP